MAVVVMWKQWEIRNNEVHGSNYSTPGDVVSWSYEYLTRYWSAQVSPPSRSNQSPSTSWSPPLPDFIKINTDASFPENSRDVWVSMVARNSMGSCVWWSKKKIIGRPSLADGEALAILLGMQIAKEHGWKNVVMESDCLQIVSYLSRASRSLASFGAILDSDSCYELYHFFESISFCFIRRIGNLLAHRLATSFTNPCSEGATLPPDIENDYK